MKLTSKTAFRTIKHLMIYFSNSPLLKRCKTEIILTFFQIMPKTVLAQSDNNLAERKLTITNTCRTFEFLSFQQNPVSVRLFGTYWRKEYCAVRWPYKAAKGTR